MDLGKGAGDFTCSPGKIAFPTQAVFVLESPVSESKNLPVRFLCFIPLAHPFSDPSSAKASLNILCFAEPRIEFLRFTIILSFLIEKPEVQGCIPI